MQSDAVASASWSFSSLIEGNYIHHTRGTSDGGNDGIEIKFGSSGNVVRNNVIHDTIIGRQYPGIFVYGGGPGTNLVEGNVIWRAGEGIQVVSDAIVRNNIIFDCASTGITATPHGAVPNVRNATLKCRDVTPKLLRCWAGFSRARRMSGACRA